MKEVKMFMMATCPHCKRAFSMMEELCAEHPEYKGVKVETIDETERPDYAEQFDYYYVPTFYVGDEKMCEGVPSKDAIDKVYQEACK